MSLICQSERCLGQQPVLDRSREKAMGENGNEEQDGEVQDELFGVIQV